MAFITLDVSKKGHMTDQCPTITSPCLFMIEVQNSQDRVTIKEEVGQQVHNNNIPTKDNFHEENEHDESTLRTMRMRKTSSTLMMSMKSTMMNLPHI